MSKRKSKKILDEEKLIEEKRKHTVMCKCSHRVSVYNLNAKGWTVCSHCGRKIMRPQDEFKNKLMAALKREENVE